MLKAHLIIWLISHFVRFVLPLLIWKLGVLYVATAFEGSFGPYGYLYGSLIGAAAWYAVGSAVHVFLAQPRFYVLATGFGLGIYWPWKTWGTEENRIAPYILQHRAQLSDTELAWWFLTNADGAVLVCIVLAVLIPALSIRYVFLFRKKHDLRGTAEGAFEAGASGSEGTAQWRDHAAAIREHSSGALVIGEALDVELERDGTWKPAGSHGASPLLFYAGDKGHVISVAGTRGGKTIGAIIPQALSWKGSAVIFDPAGQVVGVTARARRGRGQNVHVLDGTSATSAGFNALDWIDPKSPTFVTDVKAVTGWIFGTSATEEKDATGEKFWRDGPRGIVMGLMLDMFLSLPRDRWSLATIRASITRPATDLKAILQDIYDRGGLAAEYVGSLLELHEKTFTGLHQTANNDTAFLSDPAVSRMICGTSFRSADMGNGKTTVYVIIPIQMLEGTPAAARLIVGALINSVYKLDGRVSGQILFLLDEFPRLGYIRTIETARDFGAKYGITLWLACQYLGQLRDVYGERGVEGWLESAYVAQFFRQQDADTTEHVSKRVGVTTMLVRSVGDNRGSTRKPGELVSTQGSAGETLTVSEKQRRLVTADEVSRLPFGFQILFVKGERPMKCALPIYSNRQEWAALADPDRFHRSAVS